MTSVRVIGTVVAAFATAASANLLVNGDFAIAVPSNGVGGGWTSSHIDGSGGWRSGGGNLGGKFILNDGGSSVSDPTIMQTATGLTAGHRYLLSGDYASSIVNHAPSGATNSFEVLVGGVVVFQGATTNLHSWAHFEIEFIASDEALDITLRAEANGTDNDFEIDNIVLDVPSAGTLSLIGLGGLTTLRRRR